MFFLFEYDTEQQNPGRAGPYGADAWSGSFAELEEAKFARQPRDRMSAHITNASLTVVLRWELLDGWSEYGWVESPGARQ